MSTTSHDIVAKLWNLCNVLKDGGINYYQYVIELTYLLFLKMAKETGTENQLPEGYRWNDLKGQAEPEQLKFYENQLMLSWLLSWLEKMLQRQEKQ
jgi:type I restriction enzyme M protein